MGAAVTKCATLLKSATEDEDEAYAKKQQQQKQESKNSKRIAGYTVPETTSSAASSSSKAIQKQKQQKKPSSLLDNRTEIFPEDDTLLALAVLNYNSEQQQAEDGCFNQLLYCVGSEEGRVALVESTFSPQQGKMKTIVKSRCKPHTNDIMIMKYSPILSSSCSSTTESSSSSCDHLIFTASRDKKICIIKASSSSSDNDNDDSTNDNHLEIKSKIEGHTFAVTALDLITPSSSPSTESSQSSSSLYSIQHFISGSRDNTVRLWDIETTQCISMADTKLNLVHCLKWLPQLGLVAQGGEDLTIKLWDAREAATGRSPSLPLVDCLTGFDYHPICCDIVPDGVGHSIVVGHNGFNDTGSMISFWDLRMRKMIRECEGHSNTVRKICCVDNNNNNNTSENSGSSNISDEEEETHHDSDLKNNKKYVVSGSDDKTIRLWSLQGDPLSIASVDSRISSLSSLPSSSSSLKSNNSNFHVITSFRNGEVSGWKVDKGQISKTVVFA